MSYAIRIYCYTGVKVQIWEDPTLTIEDTKGVSAS